jgi:hypothetical protein
MPRDVADIMSGSRQYGTVGKGRNFMSFVTITIGAVHYRYNTGRKGVFCFVCLFFFFLFCFFFFFGFVFVFVFFSLLLSFFFCFLFFLNLG